MNAPALLDVRNVAVAYGPVEAVSDVSLHVNSGEIVTVIGPNGAGKSTLLNAIMGLLPSRGDMSFDGQGLSRRMTEERVHDGLCLVAERRELFGSMSVEDNLILGAFRRGRGETADTLAAVFDRFPRLKERRTQLAATLSGGERQMLAMGRALMSKPRLLMLDEPSLGLAPRIVQEIFSIIAALRATGVSILLVEQNARAALNAADRAYVMEIGKITLSGSAADLSRDSRIVESYLGV